DLVAELGVADPARLQPGPDRLPAEHLAHREVLADVAEELQGRQPRRPVQVADDQRRVGLGAEVKETGYLAADPLHPLGDRLPGVEHPLGRLAAGVPDQPGRPADQGDRPVPSQLEAAHGEQQDEVADVQPGRGRVETAVQGDRSRVERLAQLAEVGGLRDQPAPGQLVDDVGHRLIVPPSPAEGETALGRTRGTYGRYTDTVGSPVSQNRHGRPAALLTPTRGPWLAAARPPAPPGAARIRSADVGSHTSAPSWARSMPRAWHSRAGPRASSRPGTAGRPAPRGVPRAAASGPPSMTSPARSRMAEAVPGGRQVR